MNHTVAHDGLRMNVKNPHACIILIQTNQVQFKSLNI